MAAPAVFSVLLRPLWHTLATGCRGNVWDEQRLSSAAPALDLLQTLSRGAKKGGAAGNVAQPEEQRVVASGSSNAAAVLGRAAFAASQPAVAAVPFVLLLQSTSTQPAWPAIKRTMAESSWRGA